VRFNRNLSESLLRAIWDRINIGQRLTKALDARNFAAPIDNALFVIVANRALAPSSKLAIEQWAAHEVYLGSDDQLQVQHFYQAMDFFTGACPGC
jgi:hypothetical protein